MSRSVDVEAFASGRGLIIWAIGADSRDVRALPILRWMSELSLPLPDALRPATLCSDAQLVRRAARGEQRAFGEIFKRYHQPIYRYCRAILRNEEDAADALQNTMAAVLRGLDGEAREIALKPWLFRIAHNESLSLVRRRRPETELDEDSPVAAAGGPEVQALASERLRQLVEDLQALPDRQRGALVMRELSGLEYAQIAAAFGVGEGAARQAVYEAREMLHEIGEGRAMACAEVRELVSARDGRLLRGRKVRAHLRSCSGCEGFRAAIGQRSAALAAFAPPLPAVIGASILQGLLGGAGHGGGGAAVGAGAAATTASATAASVTTAKSLAGVGLLAKGSATAGIATKAATVLAVGATLTGGGVAATQQLQRDARHSLPAAGAVTDADAVSTRPSTVTPAAREDAQGAQRQADEHSGEATVRGPATSRQRSADRARASQRAVRQAPSTRPGALRRDRPSSRTPRSPSTAATAPARKPSPAPAPTVARRPASTPTPQQAGAAPAAPPTTPTPSSPSVTVPPPAASAPVAPSVPQAPAPTLAGTSGR